MSQPKPDPVYLYTTSWRSDDLPANHFGGITLHEQDITDIDDRLDDLKRHILTQIEAVGFVNIVLRISNTAT